MKILIVVGTRPNFIKVTQFKKLSGRFDQLDIKIVHTGQHFDRSMADIFFQQLNLYPDFFLNVNPGNAIEQMAEIMIKLQVLTVETYRPDLLMVVGDVNSTLAASLVGNKIGVKVAHLESGLRSGDRGMPEEINRVLTDVVSDIYFVTEESGKRNLMNKEMKGRIHFVGNTMIDTLVSFSEEIDNSSILESHGLTPKKYILTTLHRPSNVDSIEGLRSITEILEYLAKFRTVVFPIHPRTRNKLNEFGLLDVIEKNPEIISLGPLDYFAFQKLTKNCRFVITDSGGIQEETTFYGIPCLTLRDNTERPSTIDVGTNELVGFNMNSIKEKITLIESGKFKTGRIPDLWDGNSSERILKILAEAN